MRHERHFPNAYATRVLSYLPAHIFESLTLEERVAIGEAVKAANDPLIARHDINIRVGLPTPFGRVFLAVVGGRDGRSRRRRSQDRSRYPLATFANLFFIGGVLAVPYLIILLGTLIYGGVPLF